MQSTQFFPTDDATQNLYAIGIVVVVLVLMYVNMRFHLWANIKKIFMGDSPKESAAGDDSGFIMAYYSSGYKLEPVSSGDVQGMHYTIYITSHLDGYAVQKYAKSGSVIYCLNLPFNTQTHIVGISKKYTVDSIYLDSFLTGNELEPVVLEGDFPDTFNLYSGPDQGTEVRYILDPAAMKFAMDYCTNNFWEISGDEMYIVSAEGQKGSMDLVNDSARFVKEIKPRFTKTKPGEAPVHHESAYSTFGSTQYPCPICQTPMTIHESTQTCPNNHGMLVNARYIVKLKDKQAQPPASIGKPTKHGVITCPNCNVSMVQVDYQESGLIIDSCTSCPLRWLDASEANKIANP